MQALLETLMRFGAQKVIHVHAVRYRELRQHVLAQRQFQIAAPRDLDAVGQRLGDVGEHLGHLLGTAQVLLLAVMARAARIVEGAAVLNADARLVRFGFLAFEKTHIVAGDHRRVAGRGERNRRVQILLLAHAAGAGELQVVTLGKQRQPVAQHLLGALRLTCQQRTTDIALATTGQGDQAVAVPDQPGFVDAGNAAHLAFQITARHQASQIEIALPVLAQQHQPRRFILVLGIAHPQLDADDRLDAGGLRRAVELHHREQIGLIGHRAGRHSRCRTGRHQRLDAHQSVHQGVFGVDVQMDETGIHVTNFLTSGQGDAKQPNCIATVAYFLANGKLTLSAIRAGDIPCEKFISLDRRAVLGARLIHASAILL